MDDRTLTRSKTIHVLEVYSVPAPGFDSKHGYFDLASNTNTVSCPISASSTRSCVPISALISTLVPVVWETTSTAPLKLHADCFHMQWVSSIVVCLLCTWRPTGFSILTEGWENPQCCVLLWWCSPGARFPCRVCNCFPLPRNQITAPFLSCPHMMRALYGFSPWMGKPGQTWYCGLLH